MPLLEASGQSLFFSIFLIPILFSPLLPLASSSFSLLPVSHCLIIFLWQPLLVDCFRVDIFSSGFGEAPGASGPWMLSLGDYIRKDVQEVQAASRKVREGRREEGLWDRADKRLPEEPQPRSLLWGPPSDTSSFSQTQDATVGTQTPTMPVLFQTLQ